jgi:glycosyltransferase involved in cell wall biosynthesis
VRILFLNPFHGGSHAAVAEGYARRSQHDITLLTLSIAGGWRWRMRGAAVTFARKLREMSGSGRAMFDLILATDMLDLATFLGLTRDLVATIPVALYFHENQLTYPLPAGRVRDLSFPWMNYTSALAADAIFFNSAFHRRAFLDALPGLPGRHHDHQELDLIGSVAAKAHVLPPGIDLSRLDDEKQRTSQYATRNTQHDSPLHPVILWNSRWEYDKGPEAFFDALRELDARGVDFRVIVAGEHIDPQNRSFVAAQQWLGARALAWGFAANVAAYRELLWQADIVVSTAIQEFFGIGVVEAMYCGCVPILPHRLSYPDLLPAEHHGVCLYDDQASLVERLQTTIRDLAALKQRDFRGIAAQYDWAEMASRYDAAFERMRVP